MNAKDLMICDWVYCLSSRGEEFYPTKVKNIYHEDEDEPCGTIMEQYGCVIGSYEFKPIPLTEEILKKNRFVRKQLMKRWIISGELELIEDTMGNSVLEYWFSVSDQYICPIHYVHELQHALRLCGLYELADNFKIE